jgi:3-deoxy-D-manno-octulosonic-acid transferase
LCLRQISTFERESRKKIAQNAGFSHALRASSLFVIIWLYRILFLPIYLLMLPKYLWRMRRRGGYWKNLSQRFGTQPRLPRKNVGTRRVWLQAVSVGEMLAVGPILEALRREGVEVYLTTTTSTGYRLADDRYRGLTLAIGYFPTDWWLFSALAWRRIAPDMAILTEGERWPEHIRQARDRGVPVININARISSRSFARLRFCRRWGLPVAQLLLADISRVLACSEQDAVLFRKLGFPEQRLLSTGNIKLDVVIARLGDPEKSTLRRELGLPPEDAILLGSSTWPGEETALIAALRTVRAAGVPCSLLLVPRHAERRFEIEQLLRTSGLRYHFRSRGPAPAPVDVAVGDTTGELRRMTQLADLVFVGKSLPPHTEGQTPVESATLERPLVFGPGMGNFRTIARDLVARGAACRVASASELAAEARELMRDSGRRSALASAAAAWHRENRGALDRTLAVIREELSGSPG